MTSGPCTADMILHNGAIWCGLSEGQCQAVAIWQGRILATGTDAEILALRGPRTQVINLQGQFASPGLNDDHLHLIMLGLTMDWVDASPDVVPTLASLQAALRARAANTPKGEWIMARGYDQVKLDIGRHPDRSELDAAAPDHPVLLERACGHVAIANSLAMANAGIDENTPVPSGGLIEKINGRLTGLFAETAQDMMRSQLPDPTVEQQIAAIERAGNHLLSMGITSCMDAAVGMVAGFSEIRAYHLAKLDGKLPVRVWQVLLGDPDRSVVAECHAAGLVSGVGDDWLRVGAVKLFLDGSAGGRTAWMSAPYLPGSDQRNDNIGVQILPDEQLEQLVSEYHGMGYQMACHAIGDAAIGQLITAYEKALVAMPDPERRHRIEHCGFSTAPQHQRMRAAGIYPVPQQAFIYDFGDSYISVLGAERALASYPMRTWRDLGFKPGTGSDSPVCKPLPWPNLYAMITRKTWKGTVMDARECLTPAEALQAYTEYGAFSQKAETVKGRLVPGQLADIAVFSRNLLTADPEDILHDTHCVMTIIDGRVVYEHAA